MACMELAEKLKFLLELRSMRPADLARAARLAPARISEWKSGGGPQLNEKLDQGLRIARKIVEEIG
jgi:transcriptional regulator with XRE-family HTH domain